MGSYNKALVNLDLIREAFDRTRKSVFDNTDYWYCDYDKKCIKKKSGASINSKDFVSTWLPDSLLSVIDDIHVYSSNDIDWKRISSTSTRDDDPRNKRGIRTEDYIGSLLATVQETSFVDEFSSKIKSFIVKNCSSHKVDVNDFIDAFARELKVMVIESLDDDERYKAYISDSEKNIRINGYIEEYFHKISDSSDDIDMFCKRVALISLFVFFPSTIDIGGFSKLLRVIDSSISTDVKARYYKKNLEAYRGFRAEKYEEAFSELNNERWSGVNRIVAISGPGGEGKTALASYIYYNVDSSTYQYIWWIDYNLSFEESLINCTQIVSGIKARTPADYKRKVFDKAKETISGLSNDRMLIIVDNMGVDGLCNTEPELSFENLLANTNIDFVITTRLSPRTEIETDWRDNRQIRWVIMDRLSDAAALRVFYYYYGKEISECTLGERKVITKLIGVTANNVLAIQLLASGARYYEKGISDYYDELMRANFQYPDFHCDTEHSKYKGIDNYKEELAANQIAKLYSLTEFYDNRIKELVWYFVLPDTMWFSKDEIDQFFAEGYSCYADNLFSRGWLLFDPQKGFKIHDIINLSFLHQLENSSSEFNVEDNCGMSKFISKGYPPTVYNNIFRKFVDSVVTETNVSEPLLIPLNEAHKRAMIGLACLKHIKLTNMEVVIILEEVLRRRGYFNTSCYLEFFDELYLKLQHCAFEYWRAGEYMTNEYSFDYKSRLYDLNIQIDAFLGDDYYCGGQVDDWRRARAIYCHLLYSVFENKNPTLCYYYLSDDYNGSEMLTINENSSLYKKLSINLAEKLTELVYSSEWGIVTDWAHYASWRRLVEKPDYLTRSYPDKILYYDTDIENLKIKFILVMMHQQNYLFDLYKALLRIGILTFLIRDNIKERHDQYFFDEWIMKVYFLGEHRFPYDSSDEENVLNACIAYFSKVVDLLDGALLLLDSICDLYHSVSDNELYCASKYDRNMISCLRDVCKTQLVTMRLIRGDNDLLCEQVVENARNALLSINEMSEISNWNKMETTIAMKLCIADVLLYGESYKNAREEYASINSVLDSYIDDYYRFAIYVRSQIGAIRCEYGITGSVPLDSINALLNEIEMKGYRERFLNEIEILTHMEEIEFNELLPGTIYHCISLKDFD